ncbi:MAG: Asp23/Gls24 family envelope stress response protein [Rothia sp. (in: high G+C Gram-positive bacteria)]|nr:Asp23/Gls24 family envelope stress response protein [Rothia sp. (in: high G+C Gram-positive bacteria)]
MAQSSAPANSQPGQLESTASSSTGTLAHNIGADQTNGTTQVNDTVIAKIAGLALREVAGVYALGGGAARAMGAFRSFTGQEDNLKQGISVEVGQTQAALDLSLVVEYPYPLYQVADEARSAVIQAIESLAGLEVTEVNIEILDVHVDSEDDNQTVTAANESRVK